MGLADAAIHGIVDSLAFRASSAPYLLLDTTLRIRAANPAYERATLHDTSDMAGEFMFDVFPDNPAAPEVRAVERLGDSFERALSAGAPDRMELQRYDVCDPETGAFVEKSWLPSNWPVRDPDGHLVGVLHHVEDVTPLLVTTALERHLIASPDPADLAPARRSFPLAAIGHDVAARRATAQRLVQESRRALERMSRRIERESRG